MFLRTCFSALLVVLASSAAAQATAGKPIVYPAKGQSAKQQAADEAACHDWAVLQVGFDPAKVAPPAPPSAQAAPQQAQAAGAAPGSGAKGAVRGAAAGAVIGEVAGGDAGGGAAAGAAIGVVRGRRQSKQASAAQAQSQAQSQAAAQSGADQQYQAALADYKAKVADHSRARSACLEAKGYTVK